MGKCQSVGEYKKISLRKNPSPGGKVARPNEVRKSGSEEECGRKPNDLE